MLVNCLIITFFMKKKIIKKQLKEADIIFMFILFLNYYYLICLGIINILDALYRLKITIFTEKLNE